MRLGIYVRVSTQRQAQAQGIEQQRERLQAYVATHAAAGGKCKRSTSSATTAIAARTCAGRGSTGCATRWRPWL